MIKLYKIKIGEKIYEVEVESVTEKEGSILTSDDFNNKQKEEQRKKENNLSDNNYDKNNIEFIKAPMQGLIVDVKVKVGQKVKSGDEVVILEAMKMENPIVSPNDGTISEIKVSKGNSVNSDDILVILSK